MWRAAAPGAALEDHGSPRQQARRGSPAPLWPSPPRLGRRLATLPALSPSPCLPDSHPSPAAPGLRLPVAPAGPLAPRLCQLFARPLPLALAPQLPVPLARPVLSLQFALSKHCPGHVSQQQPTHRSSLPPRRPPRRAPGCYGNAPAARGASLGAWVPLQVLRAAKGRRSPGGPRGAWRFGRARLLPALRAGCGASGTRNRSYAIRAQGNWGDVIRGPAPDVEDNYSLLLLLHTGCWRRVVGQPRGACSARWKSGLINVAETGEWVAIR